ncbi:tetratricopeptide repeat protein [Paludisphaera mucosa]|uniref:Tetratricopeptide repeat protein n=1 Tax=Paludisphaera mucosa TaxID=3030827 RepID=A0ABT6F8T9_9BACT|nr:tetratricopeptide repeat protein [Paludisphaera mucosa]MDG3003959.1 tetratricopeptide repeat protein [Paludisphaera mucosa]
MSEVRPSPPRPRSSTSDAGRLEGRPAGPAWGLRLFDAVLIGFFLALAFLLGVFRLKDTDFYWHLRTGDLIRKWGEVPRVDFYTFTRVGAPWIDLHWMFQVGISWVFERGGVPALTLAKCLITCSALLLLITARRRTWPVWAMILAWLPALLVLSGRMYIRPETLTLLYLSIFLAVLCRWERRPALAWVLPFVQVAWVNSHGLFILGPIVLGFALIDAAMRRGALSTARRKWWTTVVPASAATALACLLNPYGIRGAFYPLELAGTMSSPDFSRTIAELKPIPDFIRETGFGNLPLQIHFATIVLGALSFLVPILAAGASRVRSLRPDASAAVEDASPTRRKGVKGPDKAAKKAVATRKKKGAVDVVEEPREDVWRVSVLRLLLFAAFSLLSFQATRNSHQFAAVVGTVTAWNFAEWIGSREVARRVRGGEVAASDGVRPRLIALTALIVLTFAVGSGSLYAWAGEGRVIGWGEEPLWFPHEAAKFAGGPGMPERFLSFHNGHASLFIYNHSPEKPGGPGKTVFTDPRLEVSGQELYRRYLDLKDWIVKDNESPRWQRELDAEGRPSILVDHDYNAEVGAALLQSGRWRCVRFDAISAVFLHDSYKSAVGAHEVDFGARHFQPSAGIDPQGVPALIAASKGLRNYANFLNAGSRPDLGRPMLWLALDYARRVVAADPESLEGWKSIGYIELIREPTAPAARCRVPFDPIFDLAPARTTYALRRAAAIAPRDFLTLALLQRTYENRGMLEPLQEILGRILRLNTINPQQANLQKSVQETQLQIANRLDEPVPTTWRNLDELDRLVNHELELGRVETAVRLLEGANPPGRGGWDAVERLSTLLLHLGEPDRARRQLQEAVDVPRPALRDARLAVCDLVEGRLEEARQQFRKAIDVEPRLFEARYGLAVLDQDDARAQEAYEQATAAMECAPSDAARGVANALASAVRRFARRERAD